MITNKSLTGLMVLIAALLLLVFWNTAHAAEVNFTWGASSGQVDGYRIYGGATTEGPYPDMLGEVDGTALTQTLTLDDTKEYFLICRAFNSYGESGDSNELHWLYELPGAPGSFDWMLNYARAILDKTGAKNMHVNLMFE